MTTLPNRPQYRADRHRRAERGGGRRPAPQRRIANINTLAGQARAQDVPVIWVQHNDDGLTRDSADGSWHRAGP